MSGLQTLDQIHGATPASVGYDAYYLGQLKQRRLPVTDGWVITADLWQQILSQVAWPQPHQADRLDTIDQHHGTGIKTISRGWRQALELACRQNPFAVEEFYCPFPRWTMRSSLGVQLPPEQLWPWVLPLHRLLPDIVGGGSGESVLNALQQLWAEGLKASSLVVWRQHCQSLGQLSLGALVLPLCSAQISGRLFITAGQAHIEVVQGMGLALRRGEAIPARCQVELGQLDQIHWQPGHQELVYQFDPAIISDPRAALHRVDEPAWQRLERPQGELYSPLNPGQVAELLDLGQQAQAILAPVKGNRDGVHLEWALCDAPGGGPLTWMITQAMPWSGPQVSASTGNLKPQEGPGKSARPSPSRLDPPALPQVSVVVKGIGASSGRVKAPAVVARQPQDLPDPLPPGCIVVLPDLQPDRFLQLGAVAGIVTEQGGATCHAAILAREMGIPAVVGAPQATQLLEPDLVLWLDGERGLVYGLPDEDRSAFSRPQADRSGPSNQDETIPQTGADPSLADDSLDPEITRYPRRTKVMVNLSQATRLQTVPMNHIDGIGLVRSEWLMLDILDRRHPWHWVEQGQGAELQARLAQTLVPILQAVGEKPVRYRSLDLRSHEWQTLEGSPPADANPMLGLRGALSYTIDSRLFEVELGALATLQGMGYDNLHLMLPFVRSVEEVIACRQYIDQAGLTQNDGFSLWIMAEVPSVLFLLPAYGRAGVQGIAIGSNDLTQLLLAVDRDQRTMASAYDERHPVVRMALAHLIQEARRNGMTCSICGQAPVRHPELITDLVAWGIDSISVEAAALPFTLKAVEEAEQGQL